MDVPPNLSARVGVLSSGNARKNDGLDALATALAASRNERLAGVDPEVGSECCACFPRGAKTWCGRAHPGAQGSLHGLLRDLLPGGVAGTLSACRAALILRGIRPQGASTRLRQRLASEVLRSLMADSQAPPSSAA